jgi:hypothetical protein
LYGCDDWFTVSRGDKVVLNTHQFKRFRSCFLRLGYVW